MLLEAAASFSQVSVLFSQTGVLMLFLLVSLPSVLYPVE